jgi:hypothetical protein
VRHAARRDKHEPDIIAALRAAGAVVQQQQPPQPDLLVSFRGQLEQLEVKDHDRSHGAAGQPHRGKRNALEGRMAWLTPAQVTWWGAWLAAGGRPPIIVLDVDEALAAIGAAVTSAELPADLVPDAVAVHLQRKPRC